MTSVATGWETLLTQVPRAAFIPDAIWIYEGGDLVPVTRQHDPQRWQAAVAADEPVITQVNLGQAGDPAFPSSSCSKPSIVAAMLDALDVQPGQAVLEIGTGTGWNAALLEHRVGRNGRVVTIEVDDAVADGARAALSATGHRPLVITGDGLAGAPEHAPYDRIIATAAIRETVAQAWLEQLCPGGVLVTPWGTDWSNGVMLTLCKTADGTAVGRFSGNLAFMRVRSQRRALYGWEPDQAEIDAAVVSTTECRGADLDRMLNPELGNFAIGARLEPCCLVVAWDKNGERRHVLELDHRASRSWARVDADLTSPEPWQVRQLGARRLWDEAEAAYDWWHDQGEPGMDRFGLTATPERQWLWLDDPDNIVRVLRVS